MSDAVYIGLFAAIMESIYSFMFAIKYQHTLDPVTWFIEHPAGFRR